MHDLGHAGVVWKNVTIRAEKMKYLAPSRGTGQLKLYVMNADGTKLRLVTGPAAPYTHLGSPEFSADGKQIAFDMSMGSTGSSRIMVVDSDGKNLKDLGLGCMPSFSADGKQIVHSQPGKGIVIMDADGGNRSVLDAAGWGAQFSPDGKYVAYGRSGNITVINVKTKERQVLLAGEAASRYSHTYWNLGWSHDGRTVAFKAQRKDTGRNEVVVADVGNPESFQVLVEEQPGIVPDFTFSPDNQKVLFAMINSPRKDPELYVVSRKKPGKLSRLEGQPEDYSYNGCAWSPDGKTIVFPGGEIPQPVDWPLEEKAAAP
jgi:Tol biopolymer transport system component